MPPVAPLLWRNLRVYKIYGANTDVGKTVVTSILCNASKRIWKDEATAYLKPVSTGPEDEADDGCLYTPTVRGCRALISNMPAGAIWILQRTSVTC